MPRIRWFGGAPPPPVAAVAAVWFVSNTTIPDACADAPWLPGASREISRTTSASRDVPVSGLVFASRVGGKAAADFAFVLLRSAGVSVRPGLFGFIEIEHPDSGVKGPLPLPGLGRGPMLWRGMYALSLAMSADALARAWLGAEGAIEVSFTAGHESDHVTGGTFDDAPNPGDIVQGGGGEFALYDLAARVELGSWKVWGRVENRAYFRGPIRHAPGVEAGARWLLRPHLQPVISVFAEALLVDHQRNTARDGVFAGLLAGLALPGPRGELVPFGAIDAGNGKGLLINRRGLDALVGFRYSPFP